MGCLHHTLPSGLRELFRRGGRWILRARSSGCHGVFQAQQDWYIHELAETSNSHRSKPDGLATLRDRHELPPLTKKLSLIGNHAQGKSLFSPMESHRLYKSYVRAGTISSIRRPTQNKFNGIFRLILFGLGILNLIDILLVY